MEDCPAPETLVAFAEGHLAAAEAERLHEHLDRCPSCLAAVSDLAGAGGTAAGPATPAAGPGPLWPLLGRFERVRVLGAGGMGVVYEAWDRERGARVALKTIRDLGAGSGGERSSPTDPLAAERLLRFKNEFRALQDLAHPNLVTLGELFEDRGQWFFTMELLDGQDLLSHARPGGALDEARLRRALGQLGRGLGALHAAGKVHRDIKPGNVRVTGAGRVVLLDFGLIAESDGPGEITGDNVVGTVAYMAPEQALARPGPPADWYSVGVMLYEALTGELPFRGKPLQVLTDKARGAAPPALPAEAPADLAALCRELLAPDPAARPGGAEVMRRLGAGEDEGPPGVEPNAGAPERPAPFCGRRGELDRLAEALAAVGSARPVVALVRGESGLGKSALAARFLDEVRARRPDALVLTGRCYERESIPYKALDGVMDSLCRHLRQLPAAEAAAVLPRRPALLPLAFPVLARVEVLAQAPPAPAIADAQELCAAVFAAVRELLARLSDRQGLVLCIDDLQWADADSVALLREILRPPDAPGLLQLATCRSGGAGLPDEALESLSGERRVIELGPLPPEEAAALARALAEQHGAAADAELLAGESAGHPLFLQELVRHTGPRAAGAPLRLEDVLRWRIGALPPEEHGVLAAVSVAAGPLSARGAARAAGVGAEALGPVVTRLRAGHLLRAAAPTGWPRGGRDRGEALEPYHDRVREAVLASLDPDAQRGWHGRLAEALEDEAALSLEALAHHHEGAGHAAAAAGYAARAAAQAAEALAFGRAASLYRKALGLRPASQGGSDDVEAAELRLRLAEALANAGRGAEAAPLFLELAARRAGGKPVALRASGSSEPAALRAASGTMALRASDGAVALHAASGAMALRARAADQLLRSGHMDEGVAVLRELLAAAGMSLPSSPGRALGRLLLARLRLALRGLRYELREAAADDPRALRIDLCRLTTGGLHTIAPIAAAEFATRMLLLSLRLGEPRRIALALAVEATQALLVTGTPAGARGHRLLDEAGGLAGRCDDPHAQAAVEMGRGVHAMVHGRWADARAAYLGSIELLRARCIGVAWELGNSQILLSTTLAQMGELAELGALIGRLQNEAADRNDRYLRTWSSIGFGGLAWLARDDVEGAHEVVAREEALASRRDHAVRDLYVLFARCHVELYRGDGAAAWAALLARRPPRVVSRSSFLRVQLGYLRGRCALAAARGGPPSLLAVAARAARQLEREDVGWARALGQLLRAGVALAGSERAAAPALHAAAAEALDAAGMGLHAAVARRRRGQLLGGAEGEALVREAEAWMRAQARGIAAPARFCDLLAPGAYDAAP